MAGTTYAFYVKAYNDVGESQQSVVATVTTPSIPNPELSYVRVHILGMSLQDTAGTNGTATGPWRFPPLAEHERDGPVVEARAGVAYLDANRNGLVDNQPSDAIQNGVFPYYSRAVDPGEHHGQSWLLRHGNMYDRIRSGPRGNIVVFAELPNTRGSLSFQQFIAAHFEVGSQHVTPISVLAGDEGHAHGRLMISSTLSPSANYQFRPPANGGFGRFVGSVRSVLHAQYPYSVVVDNLPQLHYLTYATEFELEFDVPVENQ